MLQPEALYLSFIKVHSITDQSSNDNLMFSKVIYCCINFPLLSHSPWLSMTLRGIFKGQETFFPKPWVLKWQLHPWQDWGEEFHQGSVPINPKNFRLSFFCQMFERQLGTSLYQLSVCLAAFPHHPVTHFIVISRPFFTLVLKSIFNLKFLSIYCFAYTT